MENQGVIEFNLSRNFSDKMNATFGFIRQNFKPFSKSLLLIAGPPVLLAGIFFIDIFQRLVNSDKGMDAPAPFMDVEQFGTANFILQILAIFLFLLIGGVFTIATTYAYMVLYHEKQGQQIQLREVWQRVRKIFWMNFATVFLYVFFMIIALIVLIFPLAFLVFLFAAVSPFLIVVVYLLYYVFAFFIVINFSMIFFIRNYERIGFFKSIDKLFYLNKGKWWSTFGIGGMNFYLQYIFSFLLILPGYIVIALTALHKASPTLYNKPSALVEIVTSISFVLYFLGNVLLYALPLVGLAFQYFNLVEIRQAKGLMRKIENFGKNAQGREDYADF
jgi:hypothetical protein